jgi:hypothetical protein
MTTLNQIDRAAECRAARRFGEDALGFGEQPDGVHDLDVGHGRARSAGLAHGLQHLMAVGQLPMAIDFAIVLGRTGSV